MFDDESESEDTTTQSEVMNFYFPVEVVVVGALRDTDRATIEAHMWEQLHEAIDRA